MIQRVPWRRNIWDCTTRKFSDVVHSAISDIIEVVHFMGGAAKN